MNQILILKFVEFVMTGLERECFRSFVKKNVSVTYFKDLGLTMFSFDLWGYDEKHLSFAYQIGNAVTEAALWPEEQARVLAEQVLASIEKEAKKG